jgi:hypothetical protein
MILREDIEEAFDSLKVSFLPLDIVHQETFTLHIWDKRGVAEDILRLEGQILNVPVGVILSRRALSYQAVFAYVRNAGDGIDVAKAPPDFSSEKGRGASYNEMLDLVKRSIREENLEEDTDDASTYDEQDVDEADA